MLVNPNNRLVKKVLMRMVEAAITFSLPSVPAGVTAFRSRGKNLAGLSITLAKFKDQQRRTPRPKALAQFRNA
jgi:hypothetical protein